MPTSTDEYSENTTGQTVAKAYAAQIKDKIILITGANPGGIGISTATSLAKGSPRLLILAGRSTAKLAEAIKAVQIINADVVCRPLVLDLSSQESCRTAAKEIMDDAAIPHIDIVINNAGVMNIPERTLSPDGIEMQFATNHIGHFLFTNLILPKISAAAAAAAAASSSPRAVRIVNVSSRAVLSNGVRFSDLNFTKPEAELPQAEHLSQSTRAMWGLTEDKPYTPQAAYGQSKSANVLFSVDLNRRLLDTKGVLSVALHPGVISTLLSRNMDPEQLRGALQAFRAANPDFSLKDLDQGCATTLVAALDPGLTGEDVFLSDCQVADWAPAWSTDPVLAERLWAASEQLVGQEFPV